MAELGIDAFSILRMFVEICGNDVDQAAFAAVEAERQSLMAERDKYHRQSQDLEHDQARLRAVSAAAREYLLAIEDQDLERSKRTILHLADALHALEGES